MDNKPGHGEVQDHWAGWVVLGAEGVQAREPFFRLGGPESTTSTGQKGGGGPCTRSHWRGHRPNSSGSLHRASEGELGTSGPAAQVVALPPQGNLGSETFSKPNFSFVV